MLSNAPTTNDEFAKITSVNSRSYYLRRLLVSMGIFSAEKNEELPFFEAYDVSEVKTIVDVEGNIGTLTVVILTANPTKMQAFSFDRDDVGV